MNKKLYTIPWLFLALMIFVTSAVILFSILPRTLAAQTTMEVYQQEGGKTFGREVSLDVFNDPKLGGQKLLQPFTKGSYTFAVYNNSNSTPLPYSVKFTAINPDGIPIVFSIRKNGDYIYGGAKTADMIPISENNFSKFFLGGKKTDMYTLNWEWKTESDAIDTAIGEKGVQTYKLIIAATGTIFEEGDEEFLDGELPGSDITDTGDNFNSLIWIILLIISVLMIVVLVWWIIYKRRKDKDEDTENM